MQNDLLHFILQNIRTSLQKLLGALIPKYGELPVVLKSHIYENFRLMNNLNENFQKLRKLFEPKNLLNEYESYIFFAELITFMVLCPGAKTLNFFH